LLRDTACDLWLHSPPPLSLPAVKTPLSVTTLSAALQSFPPPPSPPSRKPQPQLATAAPPPVTPARARPAPPQPPLPPPRPQRRRLWPGQQRRRSGAQLGEDLGCQRLDTCASSVGPPGAPSSAASSASLSRAALRALAWGRLVSRGEQAQPSGDEPPPAALSGRRFARAEPPVPGLAG